MLWKQVSAQRQRRVLPGLYVLSLFVASREYDSSPGVDAGLEIVVSLQTLCCSILIVSPRIIHDVRKRRWLSLFCARRDFAVFFFSAILFLR